MKIHSTPNYSYSDSFSEYKHVRTKNRNRTLTEKFTEWFRNFLESAE
mgnify:CR=1 FL=1